MARADRARWFTREDPIGLAGGLNLPPAAAGARAIPRLLRTPREVVLDGRDMRPERPARAAHGVADDRIVDGGTSLQPMLQSANLRVPMVANGVEPPRTTRDGRAGRLAHTRETT